MQTQFSLAVLIREVLEPAIMLVRDGCSHARPYCRSKLLDQRSTQEC